MDLLLTYDQESIDYNASIYDFDVPYVNHTSMMCNDQDHGEVFSLSDLG